MAEYQLQFNDDWGQFDDNTGGALRPATGGEVQTFIKSQFNTKIGYTHVLKNQNLSDGEYHVILGFANEDDCVAWESAGSDMASDKILSRANIPVAQPDPGYIIKFQSKTEKETITVGTNVKLQFKFNTYYFDPSSGTDFVAEEGKLVISKRLSASGDFTPVEYTKYTIDGSTKQNISGIESDNDTWNEVDITGILSPGTQDIMVTVTGHQSGLSTSYIYKINNVNMNLEFITNWAQTQDITNVTNPSLLLEYKVSGSVNKTLNLRISTGVDIEGNTIYKSYKRQLGYNPIDSYTVNNLVDKGILTHGIHQIEAWLSVDGRNIETPHIWSQVMVVADKEDTTPYIIINNCVDKLVNWTQQKIFEYSIYHPTLNELPIDIKFTNLDGDVTYLSASKKQPVKVMDTYSNTISINSSGDFTIKASVETDGHMLWTNRFEVQNDGMYAPTDGATFTLDVKNRYNNETQPQDIYNAITNGRVDSQWTNMKFNENSGWINDYTGAKCLRLLSGQQLDISYNPYSGWTNRGSCAMEFDIATRNVINSSTPLIRICDYNIPGVPNIPNGFELRASDAMVGLIGCSNRLEQDISFQDETRTHIMVTYTSKADFYKDPDTGIEVHLNYVRIYVNGCLTRIFEYKNDKVWDGQIPIKIQLGNESVGADLDIYNLRVYQDQKLTSDDVFQNYLSSLPTIDEKNSLLEANDIYEGGEISFNKVFGKYNTLVWKPNAHSSVKDGVYETRLATFGDGEDTKFNGDLEINIVGDKKRSGVITNMTTKGQGTSSMNYFKWNQRWEFGKIEGHDSIFISNQETGKDENGDPIYETHKGKYQLAEGMPYAKRLDGKINWASPMQSHKIGSTALYNDLWKAVVKDNTITKEGKGKYDESTGKYAGESFTNTPNGYADCRVAIKQLPFFVFVQEKSTDSSPKFYGLYTMGPSKGDKPTFGYDSKTFPGFVMMEGCNNETPIVMYGAPWNDIDVKINGKKEVFLYLESKSVDETTGKLTENWTEQWEISMGKYDETFINKYKEINNFIYTCNPFINPFDGTYEELNKEENQSQLYKNELYWVKGGENVPASNNLQDGIYYKYNLYRWDSYQEKWVNAGIEHTGDTRDSDYEMVNLKVQTGINPANYSTNEANDKFIEWRVNEFSKRVSDYFNVDDLRFTLQFIKLIAASDNWAKNTYLYTTGIDSTGKLDPIRFFQDDLDTIFATNNVGYKTKTYYIEEHDGEEVVKNPNGALAQAAIDGQSYWVSSKNALYTLAEKALNMPEMMKDILNAAANLGGSLASSSLTKLEDCFKKYYFDISTKSFPIKSYNEISKMYEDAHKAKFDGRGYNAPASALAQVTGNAVSGELQWIKQRMAYISSYAQYGLFGAGDGKGGGQGVFSFRTDQPMDTKIFVFDMTPSMWLYPSVDIAGNSTQVGRTPAGQAIRIESQAKENQTVTVRGIDYLYSMGDLSTLASDKTSLTVSASKLKDFTISNNTGFRPGSLTFSSIPNMETIKLNGSGGLQNITDVTLSKSPRLTEVDLTGTSINELSVPRGSSIQVLLLPNTVSSLDIDGLRDLTKFALNGYSNLTSVSIKNMNGNQALDSFSIFDECYKSKSPLITFIANDINWKGLTSDQLSYLLNIPNLDISGTIDITGTVTIGYDEKSNLLNRFGNIDDENNGLYVIYDKKPIANGDNIKILGPASIYDVNSIYDYKLEYLSFNSEPANDFISVDWYVEQNDLCEINQKTGKLTLTRLENGNKDVTISCVIKGYNMTGSITTYEVEKTITIGKVLAKIGDYVYANGSYGDPSDDMGNKTIVGICFWVDGSSDVNEQKRMAVAVESIPFENTETWGPNQNKNEISYNVTNLQDYSSTWNKSWTGIPWTDTNDKYVWYMYKDLAKYHILGGYLDSNGCAFNDFGWNDNPRGQYNTNQIITYRDENCTKVGLANINNWETQGFNNEYEFLRTVINLAGDNSSWYFPAASYCYSYEPGCSDLKLKNGEVLSGAFKAHNWFLPSIGELIHIWYYLCHKVDVDGKSLPGFSKLSGMTGKYIWSSTNGTSNTRAHTLQFIENAQSTYWLGGSTSNISGTDSGSKVGKRYVLPVVVF